MFRFIVILLYCLKFDTVKASPFHSSVPFFRSDYKYEPSQESFYKIHLGAKSWLGARALCEAEGAFLVGPESKTEIDIVVRIMDENLSKEVIGTHIGIHDMYAEGIYVTLDGHDVTISRDYWAPGEPNNVSDREDCVNILRSGKYNDINCASQYPFICKKTLDTLTANPRCKTSDQEPSKYLVTIGDNRKYNDIYCASQYPFICKKTLDTLTANPRCKTSDLAYLTNDKTGSCHKLHLTPKTWADAYATCHAEQSYLAIINSADEAKLFKDRLVDHPPGSLNGDFFKDGIFLGFHDMFSEGNHATIHGTPLAETGYALWSAGQPDNAGQNENCGHMYRTGLLNDIPCSFRLIFFCERDMENAAELIIDYILST